MTTTSTTDFQQFMKQRAEIALAYVNGDARPLGDIVTRREPAHFFGPNGGHVDGVDAVGQDYRDGAAHFEPGGDSRVEVLQAQDSGGLAYWVGVQHARVRVKGKPEPVPMDLRVTEIYRREDGGWRLVHRHADMLAKRQEKPAG
ncbi:MAG: YybH family protein [Burkholderiaceae bacterium]